MSVYKYISRYKYIDKTLPIPDLRRKNYLSQQFFSSHTGSLTYLPHTIRASRSINEDQILRQLFFHRSNGHEYNLARVHYFSSYITPRKLPAIGGRGGGCWTVGLNYDKTARHSSRFHPRSLSSSPNTVAPKIMIIMPARG